MNRSKVARAKRRAEAESRNTIAAYEFKGYGYWAPINRSRCDLLERLANSKLNPAKRPEGFTDEMMNELVEILRG